MKFLLFVLIFGLPLVAYSQGDRKFTVLTGSVIDQMGAVIPETKVTLTNSDGVRFESVSDEVGTYSVKIPSGTYGVEAEYKHGGFEVFKLEKYEIALTERLVFDITLKCKNCELIEHLPDISNEIIETADFRVSDKILEKPLEELPKKNKSIKRKKGNNK